MPAGCTVSEAPKIEFPALAEKDKVIPFNAAPELALLVPALNTEEFVKHPFFTFPRFAPP